jgi:hypothetical protein
MEIRRAEERDRDFVVEMAVLACDPNDRPLPSRDDEAAHALQPRPADLALIASGEGGARIGAAGGTSTSRRWCSTIAARPFQR